MATTATARSPQSNLQAFSDAPRSPLRSTHHTPARTPTPRPSISPLSTASRPAKGSPIATRDAFMAESDLHLDAEAENTMANTADDMRDDRSSSLSEPEDDDDLEERPEYLPDGPTITGKLITQKSADVDSEAETERLEESPRKLREHADSIGRTPSKLRQAAMAEDELSDPPSPLPTGAGAASSTSTVATGGQKRKRSDAEDSPLTSAESDIGELPRKRSHESPVDAPEGDEEVVPNGADAQDAKALSETRNTPGTQPSKGAKGRKGKQKGRKGKAQPESAEAEVAPDFVEAEEEPGEELAQKTEEELKRKGEAFSVFEDLAKQFTAFRERLVNERLANIENELQMLNQPTCAHPEYLRQVACIEERQAKQVREAHAYYHYRMQALRERSLGDRAQLHSQYFQEVRELRENVLYKLGEDWYAIQEERRQQHQDGDERFLYMYRTKKSAQIKQQAKYNQEVSVLSGVAKYVGFPAAPDIAGVEGNGLDEDLKAMRIPRRVHQTVPHIHHIAQPQTLQAQLQQQRPQPQDHPTYTTNPNLPPASERRAHEQFLEQNAWARPQQSTIPAHGTPNLTHTPDWVDQPGAPRHLIRNLSNHGHGQLYGQRTGSPFATPMSSKRAPSAFNSAQGNGREEDVPSSAFAAPPTAGTERRAQGRSSGSPLMVGKQRVNGNSNGNGNGNAGHLNYDREREREREPTGFRNVSGTSTIDAPLSADKASSRNPASPPSRLSPRHEARHDGSRHAHDALARPPPPFSSEVSAPQQVFETSALHRRSHNGETGNGRDLYGGGQFRIAEGSFGTPAPLAGGGGN